MSRPARRAREAVAPSTIRSERRASRLTLAQPRDARRVRGRDSRGRRRRALDRVMEHGITDVSVLQRGWLAGGNIARNTTIIRSNYLWDESAAIYEHSLKLWEGLGAELDYELLFSQRGVLNLAHTLQDVRDGVRRVSANRLNGIDAEWLDPGQV